jgi:hypothetical protein
MWKSWTTAVSLTALVSGCGTTISGDSYCDITSPLLFDSQRTVDWLVANDRALLVDVIVHNEIHGELCP